MKRLSRNVISIFATVVALTALCLATIPSRARTQTTLTVTNNSHREIRHLYFSPPNSDNWSSDQLHDSTITTGQSVTLSDIPCNQATLKVIAEDQNGCFLYQTISCGNTVSWTITDDMAADCGG
jgi:hypothetical protein